MSRKEKRPEETTAEEQKAPETAEPVQTEQPAPEAGEAETDPELAELEADAALAFLPVYDNLERALKQETADEAYKKGVEMTMTQLRSVLEKLGITEIPALGQPFDPTLHNAVMHVEDESLGENTVAEVFQAGFKLGDKVIRFSMVKVAN